MAKRSKYSAAVMAAYSKGKAYREEDKTLSFTEADDMTTEELEAYDLGREGRKLRL